MSSRRAPALGSTMFGRPSQFPGGALAAMDEAPDAGLDVHPQLRPAPPGTPVSLEPGESQTDSRPERITTHVSARHLEILRRGAHWGRSSQRAFLEAAIEAQAEAVAHRERMEWPLPPIPSR
jgi:hypothetical protein